jgi:acetyl esterase
MFTGADRWNSKWYLGCDSVRRRTSRSPIDLSPAAPTPEFPVKYSRTSLALTSLFVTFVATSCTSDDKAQPPPARQQQMALSKADPQMKAVLDELRALSPKPVETLSAPEARQQPTPTDAVMALMKKKGIDTTPEPVGDVNNRSVPGPAGSIPVRVYTPKGEGPFPVLVYFHGGGWVIATLDTYDASCRALTNMANCVVVSVDYRQAPENKWPAAHEDAYAATQWVMKNAREVQGDPRQVAVGGESAGGNLAAAVCLMAKDRRGMMPVHQMLVYPIADYRFDTPSYQANAQAKPLNKAMMMWFFDKYLNRPADGNNKYVSPLRASQSDLRGLPPATVITAEIDPLMSEGKAYAEKLKSAGVDVAYRNFDGVAHEFFGMGPVVDKAKESQQFAAGRLRDTMDRGDD